MQNNSIAVWLIFLSGILVLFFRLFQAKIKGIIGEKKVALLLTGLKTSNYKVLNNVVLERNGRTSQIDHIVVSDYGIFVIEMKNYKGWILGNEHSEYWTQILFHRKEKLYNPIRQNRSHIAALKHFLSEFPNVKYVSVIVFSSAVTLKVKTETTVTYPFKLLGFIKSHSEVNLSQHEKEMIFDKISLFNASRTYDRKQHIKTIKEAIKNREGSIQQSKCPRCGYKLVERQGSYGKFMGCSNYPKCRFTKST